MTAGNAHPLAGGSAEAATAGNDPGRDESEAERDDRNLAELLQELRVAGLGVQVLFGFLLSLPFTVRFVRLSSSQRSLYVASLLLAALSTVLLCGPVAYHRLVFRRHEKERLLWAANLMALGGLATVALAISTAVLLVVSVVERGAPVLIIAVGTFTAFAVLWFAFPLTRRRPSGKDAMRSASTSPPTDQAGTEKTGRSG